MATAMINMFEEIVAQFAQLRATVVGDVMLDRYVVGRVRRISPEAPVPIVEVDRTFHRPGGAGNVAANLTRLGASTTLVATVGDDPDGAALREILESNDIAPDSLVVGGSRVTTVKTRVIAQGQQIVRVDQEMSRSSDQAVVNDILARVATADPADVVILSDYAKGVLSPWVCREVIRACLDRGVPVVVDPKGTDYRRYARATAITPNQSEAAKAIGVTDGEALPLDELREFLLETLDVAAGIITRGEHGVTVLQPDQPDENLPATALEVADVTGAGDTFVATLALGLGAKSKVLEAAMIANVAAGVVVGRLGAATITSGELLDALRTQQTKKLRRAQR
jgi:D-beta-D-heptose 7-phosphate kinase/D-beta-D-heptose 1-phosphate adenosyltransferase